MSAMALARPTPACRYYGKSQNALRTTGLLIAVVECERDVLFHDECAAASDCHEHCTMERLNYLPDEQRCPIAKLRMSEGGPL